MNEITAILTAIQSLEARFPGRKFTPGGTLVGSLGEVLAEQAYDLRLEPQGTKGHDAIDGKGRRIQIRINSTGGTPLKSNLPDYLLALKFTAQGEFEEVYNGPGDILRPLLSGRKSDSSGFIAVRHTKLRAMMAQVPLSERIPRRPESLSKEAS